MYPKREHNAEDIKLINKNLEDVREAPLGEREEEPLTADTVTLSVDEKLQAKIRFMVLNHEHLWSGKVEKISVIKHHIILVPSPRPFKYAPNIAIRNRMNI